jgi:peptidoglycan/xylan/chitin deacetylase (PgdA/CDA1 family)
MILAYHNINDNADDFWSVSPAIFDEDMKWLKDNGYECMSLFEYYETGHNDRSIVLTFDDGNKDFIQTALPILNKHGFKATVFVLAGLSGKTSVWREDKHITDLMDWADVNVIASQEFEIGSHGMFHANFLTLSDTDLVDELTVSKNMIEDAICGAVNSLSYPYCGYNAHVMETVRNTGYKYAVAGDNGYNEPLALKRRGMHRPDRIKDVLA